MPRNRACKSGDWHFIIAAMVAFCVLTIVEPVVYSARPAEAQAGVIREIRVVGNRRVEPETVRTYLRFNVGDAYDPAKVDRSIQSLFATGLFADVRIDREGSRRGDHGGREPGRQPGRLRGQSGSRKDDADQRGAAQAALGVHARQGAGGRAAHSRHLSPPGPLCGLRRAQDHRARQQSRQRCVRDQRGRGDQGPGHQLHRQQGVLRLPAPRYHHDDAVGVVRLHQRHQHLRSRSAGAGSGAAASVLPEERLRRRAHRVGRRRACPRRIGLQHHLRGRRGGALHLRQDRHRSLRLPASIRRPCATSC